MRSTHKSFLENTSVLGVSKTYGTIVFYVGAMNPQRGTLSTFRADRHETLNSFESLSLVTAENFWISEDHVRAQIVRRLF